MQKTQPRETDEQKERRQALEAEQEAAEEEEFGPTRFHFHFAGDPLEDEAKEFTFAGPAGDEVGFVRPRSLNFFEDGQLRNGGQEVVLDEDEFKKGRNVVKLSRDVDPDHVLLKHGIAEFRLPDFDANGSMLLTPNRDGILFRTEANFKTPEQRLGFFLRMPPVLAQAVVMEVRRCNAKAKKGAVGDAASNGSSTRSNGSTAG